MSPRYSPVSSAVSAPPATSEDFPPLGHSKVDVREAVTGMAWHPAVTRVSWSSGASRAPRRTDGLLECTWSP